MNHTKLQQNRKYTKLQKNPKVPLLLLSKIYKIGDYMGRQIQQIEPWSAKESKKELRLFGNAKFLGGRGPLEQLKIGPFDQ